MVNVGGRSKGCSTCRRRRVKCDETSPVCKRCQKSGLECGGPKGITFIEGKIVESRRKHDLVIVPTERRLESVHHAVISIPSSMSMKGNETHIYLCFTLKHLRGGPIDLALQGTRLEDISTSENAAVNGQPFGQAILSFAAIFFGAQHAQAVISNHGYSMLGVALKQLNDALSDPKCYTRDEVLLSVITLALLESFVPTGQNHYLKHMVGLERLLELRSPDLQHFAASSDLYRGIRHMILFASLHTRRPSILARPEWKRVLRANCSDQEMQEQDLFDVIADCTVLLADRDGIFKKWDGFSNSDVNRLGEIKWQALTLLTYLHSWRGRWETDLRTSQSEVPTRGEILQSLSIFPKDKPPLLLAGSEFLNDQTATMLMLYNSALICVLQVLATSPPDDLGIDLHQGLPASKSSRRVCSFDHQRQTRDDFAAAKMTAALEICHYLPHLSRKSYPSSRVVHLAVIIAWNALGGDTSVEGRWMRDILSTPGQEHIARGLWTARPDPANASHED